MFKKIIYFCLGYLAASLTSLAIYFYLPHFAKDTPEVKAGVSYIKPQENTIKNVDFKADDRYLKPPQWTQENIDEAPKNDLEKSILNSIKNKDSSVSDSDVSDSTSHVSKSKNDHVASTYGIEDSERPVPERKLKQLQINHILK